MIFPRACWSQWPWDPNRSSVPRWPRTTKNTSGMLNCVRVSEDISQSIQYKQYNSEDIPLIRLYWMFMDFEWSSNPRLTPFMVYGPWPCWNTSWYFLSGENWWRAGLGYSIAMPCNAQVERWLEMIARKTVKILGLLWIDYIPFRWFQWCKTNPVQFHTRSKTLFVFVVFSCTWMTSMTSVYFTLGKPTST